MKYVKLAATLATAVFGLTLVGCSSHQSNYEGTRLVVDWEQVQRVEQSARGNASVIWLNYPRKRLDAQGRVVERINQHGEVVARYEYDDADNPVRIR